MTTEVFVERLKTRYGDRYDYSRVKFVSNVTPIEIYCNKHKIWITNKTPELINKSSVCKLCTKEEMAAKAKARGPEFIAKAREAHNNLYEYDLDSYTDTKTTFRIKCSKHGWFEQTISNHIAKKTICPKCNRENHSVRHTLTNEQFIAKAKAKTGDRYDYSKVDYKHTKTPVTIYCKKHQKWFEQAPGRHLEAPGCDQCHKENVLAARDPQRLTTEEFIERSKEIHINKYDYSKTKYVNYETKLIVTCPIHGDVEQWPGAHLQGNGCKYCAHKETGEKNKKDLKHFMTRSKAIHGDKYDYSLAEYVHVNTPIALRCKKHDHVFKQVPWVHYQGHEGCKKCNSETLTKIRSHDTEQFIANAKKVHGDTYDYSLVDYVNSRTKVKIICKEHGVFEQKPKSHSMDSYTGCPVCASSKGEKKVFWFLTNNNISFVREYILPGSGNNYRYDFYLDKHNVLIEYDGELHYKAIDYFGGIDTLIETQRRDKLKDEMAKAFNIPIIRIPYTEFYKVEIVLAQELSKIYKYKVKDKLYRNFLELCQGERLPGNTKPEDVEQHKLINLARQYEHDQNEIEKELFET